MWSYKSSSLLDYAFKSDIFNIDDILEILFVVCAAVVCKVPSRQANLATLHINGLNQSYFQTSSVNCLIKFGSQIKITLLVNMAIFKISWWLTWLLRSLGTTKQLVICIGNTSSQFLYRYSQLSFYNFLSQTEIK